MQKILKKDYKELKPHIWYISVVAYRNLLEN